MIHLVTGSLALLRHTSWWDAGAGLEVELSTIASSALPGHTDRGSDGQIARGHLTLVSIRSNESKIIVRKDTDYCTSLF